MASQSSSWNESESKSEPVLINNPASDWQLILSRLLGQLGSDQYQWALNQFAKLDSLTDTQIDNFLRLGDVGLQQAQGLFDRYEDTYAPLADQYAREAETYASPARIQHGMGRAQAHAMQAGNQGLINAERQLQAMGIDPSSGRYQDLVRASNTANAAAAAAAGEVERDRIEQTGRQMRENAMAYGQNLPSQSVNALNQAFQGVSGAINAGLGRANAGVNLTQSAAPYYNAAMGVRPPPTGQNSTSQGRGASSSGSGGGGSSPRQPQQQQNRGGQQQGGGGSGYPTGAGGLPDRYTGSGPQTIQNPNYRGGPNIQNVPPFERDPEFPSFWQGTVPDPYNLMPGGDRIPNLPGGEWPGIQGDHDWSGYESAAYYNPFTGAYGGPSNSQFVNDPFGNSQWDASGVNPDPWGQFSNMPDWSLPPDPNAANPWTDGMFDADAWYQQYQQDQQAADPWSSQFYDYGQQNPDYSAWDQSRGFSGGGYSDPWAGSSDWYSQVPSYPDAPTSGWDAPAPSYSDSYWPSPSYDSGGGWSDYGGESYAYAGGGHVAPQMSPSGGRQIDDVPAVIQQTGQRAMLNSDEFVIPRDVALWKGQEFFQSLIKKSREARVGAPAKPSNKRPQGQNPGAGNAQRMA